MLHANRMALYFIEPELWAIEVCIAGIGFWTLSAPVTLTLTTSLSYTNLTRIAWRYTGCTNMSFLCQGFQKISYDRQTDRHTYIHTYIHIHTYRQTDRIDRNYKALRYVSAQMVFALMFLVFLRPNVCKAHFSGSPKMSAFKRDTPIDSKNVTNNLRYLGNCAR